MQDGPKAVWSIPYNSVAIFPSLKQTFIAYCSSKVSWCPDCIFEIHQLWQSGFCRVYFNCCCSYSFEAEIIKIGQSSHKMYSNKILNFQESTIILNACTKKSRTYWMHHVYTHTHTHTHTHTYISVFVCVYIYIYIYACVSIYVSVYMCVCVCVCVMFNKVVAGIPVYLSYALALFPLVFVCVYIYIYIVIHRQVCFVLSELISVARQ